MDNPRALRLADLVLQNEGGWSNHAADKGGATRFGVTAETARRHGLDVHSLTIEQARQIYVEDYWRWDWATSDALASKLFDISVNSGTKAAVVLLQRALATLGHSVAVDGLIGEQTKYAANRENQSALLAALAYHHAERYIGIVRTDPTQSAFIRGWLIRAMKGISV